MASESLYYGKRWRHFLAISLAYVCCDFNSSQLRRCELFFGYDTIAKNDHYFWDTLFVLIGTERLILFLSKNKLRNRTFCDTVKRPKQLLKLLKSPRAKHTFGEKIILKIRPQPRKLLDHWKMSSQKKKFRFADLKKALSRFHKMFLTFSTARIVWISVILF